MMDGAILLYTLPKNAEREREREDTKKRAELECNKRFMKGNLCVNFSRKANKKRTRQIRSRTSTAMPPPEQ
jgi:hypothetical protein